MIRSLRLRLLLHTSLASVLILGLLGIGVYLSMRRSLRSEFDEGLTAKARALAATTELHNQSVIFDFDADQLPEFFTKNHPDYFEAWIDSEPLARSATLGNRDLPYQLPVRGFIYQNVDLPDGRRGRMVTMSFPLQFHGDGTGKGEPSNNARQIVLAVATQTTYLRGTIEKLGWLLLGLCSLAVIVSGAVLLFIVGRTVRPVRQMAQDIEQLRETDLSQRLHSPQVPSELKPVIEKLNGLLSRLESAFTREKSFTADVAHELRTPLAGLQTTLEVCLSRPREPAAYMTAIDKCLSMTTRMQNMVATLLLLARAEGGQLQLALKPTDVGNLLEECWNMFSARAAERRLQVDWNVGANCIARSDAEKLRIVFHNLFDNAVSHADEGGSLRIQANTAGLSVRIEVANSGSLVAAHESKQLCERFWRGDQSRAETGIHCGLGLSLCQRLVQLLGGGIQIETVRGGWFTAVVTVPLAQPQSTNPANTLEPSPTIELSTR